MSGASSTGESHGSITGSEAFAAIFSRYRDDVYRVCLRHLRDPELAEDATQDTFLRAYAAFDRFDRSRTIWPWILSIAARRCIDVRRHGAWTTPEETFDGAAWIDQRKEDPLDLAIATESRRTLKQELSKLPSRQRRALLLYALEGWSYEEIASAQGISLPSVKCLIYRARGRLREVYREN